MHANLTHSELADELTRVAEADHRATAGAHSDALALQLAWRRLPARHGDRLAAMMAEHGWPTTATVGEDASRAAWLIAQHVDRQLDVQRQALALLEEAVEAGEASAVQLAFLRDRTYVNEGREQPYGTQDRRLRDGAPVPWPCTEPGRLDERRAEVGIAPFAACTARHAPPATG